MKYFIISLLLLLAFSPSSRSQGFIEMDGLLSNLLGIIDLNTKVETILTFTSASAITPSVLEYLGGSLLGQLNLQLLTIDGLPVLGVAGLKQQLLALIATPPAGATSLFLNRAITYHLHESVPLTHANYVQNQMHVTGKNIGIAVVDSGIDATLLDLPYGQVVVQNIKVVGSSYFTTAGGLILKNLKNTDIGTGHGTVVAGIIASQGVSSNRYYKGMAPGAKLVGVSCGEAGTILSALQGWGWVLANKATYNIRVVTNSWGTTGAYSENDPVNVASRVLFNNGLVVVFSAGNNGPAIGTINPYSVAPWVISVASGEKDGRTVSSFSSRGTPGSSTLRPTLTAPGSMIASDRAALGLVGSINNLPYDLALCSIPLLYRFSYTCSSGTSMAAPHVAATVALMLEVNPGLTPTVVKNVLMQTAVPMPNYALHEAGAGYLDAQSAVEQSRNLL